MALITALGLGLARDHLGGASEELSSTATEERHTPRSVAASRTVEPRRTPQERSSAGETPTSTSADRQRTEKAQYDVENALRSFCEHRSLTMSLDRAANPNTPFSRSLMRDARWQVRTGCLWKVSNLVQRAHREVDMPLGSSTPEDAAQLIAKLRLVDRRASTSLQSAVDAGHNPLHLEGPVRDARIALRVLSYLEDESDPVIRTALMEWGRGTEIRITSRLDYRSRTGR